MKKRMMGSEVGLLVESLLCERFVKGGQNRGRGSGFGDSGGVGGGSFCYPWWRGVFWLIGPGDI